MPEPTKRVQKLLRELAGQAWEAEMRVALGALARKFEQWEAGTLSSAELHDAIHAYHNGEAREIWKRHSMPDPRIPLAHAVATGVIAREKLPPEALEHLASLIELFEDQRREG